MIGGIPMDRLVLLFDAAIAVLLLATIVYAAILHQKLSVLRDSRQQMEQLVGRFTEANATAEKVLAEIRQAAGESGQALQGSIERGNALADDLMFLVERAGGLAKRLEGAGRRSGGVARAKDAEVRPTATAQPAATAGAAAETDFVKALRALR